MQNPQQSHCAHHKLATLQLEIYTQLPRRSIKSFFMTVPLHGTVEEASFKIADHLEAEPDIPFATHQGWEFYIKPKLPNSCVAKNFFGKFLDAPWQPWLTRDNAQRSIGARLESIGYSLAQEAHMPSTDADGRKLPNLRSTEPIPMLIIGYPYKQCFVSAPKTMLKYAFFTLAEHAAAEDTPSLEAHERSRLATEPAKHQPPALKVMLKSEHPLDVLFPAKHALKLYASDPMVRMFCDAQPDAISDWSKYMVYHVCCVCADVEKREKLRAALSSSYSACLTAQRTLVQHAKTMAPHLNVTVLWQHCAATLNDLCRRYFARDAKNILRMSPEEREALSLPSFDEYSSALQQRLQPPSYTNDIDALASWIGGAPRAKQKPRTRAQRAPRASPKARAQRTPPRESASKAEQDRTLTLDQKKQLDAEVKAFRKLLEQHKVETQRIKLDQRVSAAIKHALAQRNT